eukprot:1485288-Rhodomonas_salina.2
MPHACAIVQNSSGLPPQTLSTTPRTCNSLFSLQRACCAGVARTGTMSEMRAMRTRAAAAPPRVQSQVQAERKAAHPTHDTTASISASPTQSPAAPHCQRTVLWAFCFQDAGGFFEGSFTVLEFFLSSRL